MSLEAPLGLAVVRELAVARDPDLADRPLVGYALATVDIDRAVEVSLFEDGSTWAPAPRDELLGARAMVRRGHAPQDGPRVVLLEPHTEGRLAASLARFGEGIAAIYLAGPAPMSAAGSAWAAAADARYGRRADGPLGPGRLLLGGPAWGPHVIVLDPDGATP